MEIAPLSGPLGAEVWGRDLARGLDQNALAEVRAALAAYRLLAFRDQELTPEQHVALTGRLGGVPRLPFIAPLAPHPETIAPAPSPRLAARGLVLLLQFLRIADEAARGGADGCALDNDRKNHHHVGRGQNQFAQAARGQR